MQKHFTWPPCTQRCENVTTCQQHTASTTLFKQLINNYMLCPASEVGFSGWTFKGCPVTNIPILGSVTPYLTDPSSECFERAIQWERSSSTDKTVPDGLCSTRLTCWTSHTKFCAPLKLDNLLGVRFRGASMGSRATWAQRKQSSEMQREAVV